MKMPCNDKSIPSVVTCTTIDQDVLAGQRAILPQEDLDNGAACVLHQHNAGDAALIHGASIEIPYLFRRYDLHSHSPFLIHHYGNLNRLPIKMQESRID